MKRFLRAVSLISLGSLVVLFQSVVEVRGQLDQENWHPEKIGVGVNISVGFQQEFTPTLNALDTVQVPFGLEGSILVPPWGGSGTAAVRIRDGGVGGSVIGVSDPTYLPPRFAGGAIFKFSSPVALTPGRLYAFEPFSVDGTGQWMMGLAFTPDYVGGRLSVGGAFDPTFNLVFREGIGLIPEPSPFILMAMGILGFIATNYRKRPCSIPCHGLIQSSR